WGNVVSRRGTTNEALLWIGQVAYYFDTETGLAYVRGRIYHPAVGRWTSADPLLFWDSFNRFLHVLNSPIQFTDPSGLFCAANACCGPEISENITQTLKKAIELFDSLPLLTRLRHCINPWILLNFDMSPLHDHQYDNHFQALGPGKNCPTGNDVNCCMEC